MTDDIGRGDNSSKLVKLFRRLTADENAKGGVDEILLAVRLIKTTLKSHGADIHDLADVLDKYEKGELSEVREDFYKQTYLRAYQKGVEDERKKMAQSGAVGFSPADKDEVSWQQAVLYAEQRVTRLNSWEQGLINDMALQMRYAPSKDPSEKQTLHIFKIYRRLGGRV